MDLHEILNDPSVLELKRLANDLKDHPGRINAPSLTFPEAWQSVWKSAKGQPLQDKIHKKYGSITLIPQPDGSIGVSASGPGPWGGVGPGQGEINMQRDIAGKARAMACESVVKAIRADHPNFTYDEAWQIARAEHKQLFVGGETDTPVKASTSVKVIGIRRDI